MQSKKLFSEVLVGSYVLGHRVVMAPMTRMRANPDGTVSDIMIEHYGQRASQGALQIMEGSAVSPKGNAFQGSPSIHDDRFIPGFAKLARAVHAKGGRIFSQIYHAGRASHVSLQPDGEAPVAPSALPFAGDAYTLKGQVKASPARALSLNELPYIVEEFRAAAQRVKAAGFDGVEVHFANGYLLDQFLEDASNRRTDRYGGSYENRTRLPLEVLEAAVSVWGRSRVGVRISPGGKFNKMDDSNTDALFGYLAEQLNRFDLAYLHVVEPRISGANTDEDAESVKAVACSHLRMFYRGTIIAAGGFDRESAEAILQEGDADLVAFGRFFISNPDLPTRLKHGHPLKEYDRSALYGGDARGYNDFPSYSELAAGEQSSDSLSLA